MGAVEPNGRTAAAFVQSLGQLLKASGRSQRAIQKGLATVHGVLHGTGGFPSEDTVLGLVRVYAPRNQGAWLRARGNAAEAAPVRPKAPTVRELQEQLVVQRGELEELRRRVDGLVGMVQEAAATKDGDQEHRVRFQGDQARRWLASRVQPVLQRPRRNAGRTEGYDRFQVDAFVADLLMRVREAPPEEIERFLGRAEFHLSSTESNSIRMDLYSMESVHSWIRQVKEDLVEFFHRLPAELQ
ncbi:MULTISPECIES: hypothetical protein [Streptomyces]|uniref:hypothetical protein n=1 Tax=Streptomyces TaxID=1883 RepID=UPI0009A4ECC8|nr:MULTISPECIES: hypothetical protein [Streptomyces]